MPRARQWGTPLPWKRLTLRLREGQVIEVPELSILVIGDRGQARCAEARASLDRALGTASSRSAEPQRSIDGSLEGGDHSDHPVRAGVGSIEVTVSPGMAGRQGAAPGHSSPARLAPWRSVSSLVLRRRHGR